MKNKHLHKCCCCGKTAIWKNQKNDGTPKYYCDDCVPRYFNINNIYNIEDFGEPQINSVMWWGYNAKLSDMKNKGEKTRKKDSFYYEYCDSIGRRLPSGKFVLSTKGFPFKEASYVVCYDDIREYYDLTCKYLTFGEAKEVGSFLFDLLEMLSPKKQDVDYNIFMSVFAEYMYEFMMDNIKNKKMINKFFQNFKRLLSEIKSC